MAVIEAIQTQRVQVPDGVSAIEFTGFPSTYRNLQLRVSALTVDTGGSEDHLEIRFATGGSYSWQVGSSTYTAHGCGVYNGNNVTTESYNGSGGATITCGRRGYAGTYGGGYPQYGRGFAAAVIDIADYDPDYDQQYTTVRTMSLGWSGGSRGVVGVHSGIFLDYGAVTGVQIYARSGAYLAMGTTATLYGMNS